MRASRATTSPMMEAHQSMRAVSGKRATLAPHSRIMMHSESEHVCMLVAASARLTMHAIVLLCDGCSAGAFTNKSNGTYEKEASAFTSLLEQGTSLTFTLPVTCTVSCSRTSLHSSRHGARRILRHEEGHRQKEGCPRQGARTREEKVWRRNPGEFFVFDWDGLKRRESYSMAWARSRDDECSALFLQSLRAFHRK